jgi:predicted glycosyltransferase
MRTRRPSIVLVCEVNLGVGHLTRMLILASALSQRFRVVLIVVAPDSQQFETPADVELHVINRPKPPSPGNLQTVAAKMLGIAAEVRPAVVIVEYFPFGRHASLPYFLPFLKGLRLACEGNVKILCSIRDIQDRKLEALPAASVAYLANQHFDGILIHSDPRVTRLEETFEASAAIRIPLYYTNYVSRHGRNSGLPSERSKTILVSVGGGRGGEAVLGCAVAAAKKGLLDGYRLRILGGRLLLQRDWDDLVARCSDAGETVELLRWVPDLFSELRNAAVSVSRCGYNTAQDLLASGVPALVIPFATQKDDEQMRRASLLSRMGAIRVLIEEQMTTESLASEILRTFDFRPAPLAARLDGAERTCNIIAELSAGRQVEVAAE